MSVTGKLLRFFNPVAFRQMKSPHIKYPVLLLSTQKTVENLSKTYQKLLDLPADAKISRHTFESYANTLRTSLEQLDKKEAFFAYAAFMEMCSELYQLSKFPEDGGNVYTLPELCEVVLAMPKDSLYFYAGLYARSVFRAIDTNRNGFISRDEWALHLKVRNSYESDEQALRSFDSLDTNKDGRISLEEFEDAAVKFWDSAGSDEKVEDYYGTKEQ